MPGGTLQIASYHLDGPDFTTINPNITYFKSVHKRYTNFSIENILVNFNSFDDINFYDQMKLNCNLDNIGHLLNNVYLYIEVPSFFQNDVLKVKWIDDIGINIIDEITLSIGGEIIQSFSNDWINVYYKRYFTYEEYLSTKKMVNIHPSPHSTKYLNTLNKLYIYLPFYFSKQNGLNIPLMNLKYQDIMINITLKPVSNWFTVIEQNINSPYYGKRIKPYGNYITLIKNAIDKSRGESFHFSLETHVIFLEKDELNNITYSQHDYLIENISEIIVNDITEKDTFVKLNQRLPLKEFWLVAMRNDIDTRNCWGQYSNIENRDEGDLSLPRNNLQSIYTPTVFLRQYWDNIKEKSNSVIIKNIIKSLKIIIDKQDRTIDLSNNYLSSVNPYQYKLNYNSDDQVYHYSFSLDPLQYQPSGFCNLDRSSDFILKISLNNIPPLKPTNTFLTQILNGGANSDEYKPYMNDTYAWKYSYKLILINYNILRINSGMADLLLRK
jgi:hypothetical protein